MKLFPKPTTKQKQNLFSSTVTDVATTALESAINGDNREEIKQHVKNNLRESTKESATLLLESIGDSIERETEVGKYDIRLTEDGTVVGNYKNLGFALKVDPMNLDSAAITLALFGNRTNPDVPSVLTGYNTSIKPANNADEDYDTYKNFLNTSSSVLVAKIRATSVSKSDLVRKIELTDLKLVLKDALDLAITKSQLQK